MIIVRRRKNSLGPSSAVGVFATMERETELAPRRISDLLVLPRSSFSFRRSSLDDDISVSELSLKEWAPAPVITRQAPPSPEKEIVVVSNGTLKGNIRTRYLPLDPNDGGNVPHGGVPTKLPSPEIKREELSATGGGLNGGHVPTKLPTEDEVVQNSPGSENGHLIHLSPGRALPKPIAFDISFDDSVEKKQGRNAPLKVSFMDGVEIGSPNVPAKSRTTKARGNASQKDTSAKSSSRNNPPPWERSTKVGVQPSPVPKKIITPTSHGLKIKKGVTAVRPRGTNAAPSLQRFRSSREYTTDQGDYRTDHNLVTKSLDSSNYGGWECHSSTVVRKSLDSNFFGGGEYDSTSKLITKSLSSPSYSSDEIPKSGSRVYVPRNNGGRKSEVEEEEDDDEVLADTLCDLLAHVFIREPSCS